MILCLPFLMFQGRAQEAIDLYLDTFPDAELLEIMHHPEGTEIYDPGPDPLAAAPEQVEDTEDQAPTLDDEDLADQRLHEADGGADEDQAETGLSGAEVDDIELDEAEPEADVLAAPEADEFDGDPAQRPDTPAAAEDVSDLRPETQAARFDDTAAMETVVDWETTLVATAQLKIGGQILMIQDSLIKRDFDFTPSISVAVVVDTEEEFFRITDSLSQEGGFLMGPGEYDFAANFAWVRDRFGVTWQINQPAAPTNSEAPTVQAPVTGLG